MSFICLIEVETHFRLQRNIIACHIRDLQLSLLKKKIKNRNKLFSFNIDNRLHAPSPFHSDLIFHQKFAWHSLAAST